MDTVKKLSESIENLKWRLDHDPELKQRREIVNSPTLLRLYIDHEYPLPGDRSATIRGEVLPILEELQQALETIQKELCAMKEERQQRCLAEVGGHISRDDDDEPGE